MTIKGVIDFRMSQEDEDQEFRMAHCGHCEMNYKKNHNKCLCDNIEGVCYCNHHDN